MTTQNRGFVQPYSPMSPLKTQLRSIAKISDVEVVKLASQKTQKEVEQTKSAKLYKALPAIATGVLTLAAGATKSGTLSKKMGAAAATLGFIAGGNILLDKTFALFNKKDKNKESKMNPYLKAGLEIAGSIGVLALALFGITKGKNAFVKYFPKATDGIAKQVNKVSNAIDKSKIAKGITKATDGAKRFLTKHPVMNKTGKFVLDNSFILTILGYFLGNTLLGSKISKNTQEKFDKNLDDIAAIRDEANTALSIVEATEAMTQMSPAKMMGQFFASQVSMF